MTESNQTATEELVKCHGIIGHPNKASFLAIRHSSGWTVPTVKYPPGPVDYRAEMINEGIFRKYGLHTRVLRPVLLSGRYHCLEMELVGTGERRLEAVWVDREQYERFRTPADGQPDPFAQWLDERERSADQQPVLRPPWECPGWFDTASHWLQFQLDRLQIQTVGSIEQYRIGSGAACLLRVKTNEGRVYLKAGHSRPPAEATLTQALAEKWPTRVPAPLVVDAGRNWMLNRDFSREGPNPSNADELAKCVRALAELQVASAVDPDEWRALGCPVHDLAYLDDFARDLEPLSGWLRAGKGGLTDEEIGKLAEALRVQRELLDELAGFGLPNTLIHRDFRSDNVNLGPGGPVISDWADTSIGHPFFALETTWRTHFGHGPQHMPELGDAGQAKDTDQSPQAFRSPYEQDLPVLSEAYLEPFGSLAPAEALQRALQLARQLYRLWNLTRLGEDLRWTEQESPRHVQGVVFLQWAARKLIGGAYV